MSRYVPSWDFEEISHNNHVDITKPDSFAFNGSVTDYEAEIVELKWENGQPVFHDLRQPRAPFKPDFPKRIYSWDKPSGAAGTLESIVNQATTSLDPQINNASIINTNNRHGGDDHAVVDAENLVPWFEDHCVKIGGSANGDTGGNKVPVDALEPSRVENNNDRDTTIERGSNCPVTNEDTVNNSSGVGWTLSSSLGAPGSTFSGKSTNSKTTYTVDDYGSNSLCSGEPQQRKIGNGDTQRKRATIKSSVSTKASRAAAVHNQSERKRRDKINQRLKALQKLVPNSNKNDKSSMLDEVIEYLKQLQSRVNAVKRMNSMSSMMLPSLAMQQQQQQLQMSMMNPLGGMGNHAMDLNSMMAPIHNLTAIPSVIPLPPTSLLPLNPWEASGVDRFAAFAACHQSQPMTMDAYAALYQQSNNIPGFMG